MNIIVKMHDRVRVIETTRMDLHSGIMLEDDFLDISDYLNQGVLLERSVFITTSDDMQLLKRAVTIIEPDEFGADENYETSFLSFYADGKLVFDGEDEPMDEDDISRAVGDEALKHFGEFMPSTIHVRNHNYHKDYEILQVNQSFCDLHPDEEDE